MLSFAIKNNLPIVIATTGYSEAQTEKIKEASNIIPIFFTFNMSIGVNLICSLAKKAASILGDDLDIYSGNDDQIVPIMSIGGIGVISVLSNILPLETHNICEYYLNGKEKLAGEMQVKYTGLINALFCDVNPTPIKTAMNLLGLDVGPLRLPLYPMNDANLNFLKAKLLECGFKI